jgi:hypothetical protein
MKTLPKVFWHWINLIGNNDMFNKYIFIMDFLVKGNELTKNIYSCSFPKVYYVHSNLM